MAKLFLPMLEAAGESSGCATGCVVSLMLLFGAGVWLNFALDYERERAVSPDGDWVATAYINGAPLTAENGKVHIWRWWQPRFRWLGCEVLDARNEAPIRLLWTGSRRLSVEHGFRPQDLIGVQRHCGPVRISIERKFSPYS